MFTATDVLKPEFNEQSLDDLWSLISPLYMVDETQWLEQLLPLATPSESEKKQIADKTTSLIESIRADKTSIQMIDALLLEYSLDTQEGILLMCLAEALMRIPDSATADALIRDKLSVADWKSHLKNSDSVFVNASTWGLMLTGKVVGLSSNEQSAGQAVNRLVNKLSEPVIRKAMHQAMKVMGHQFVLGRSIAEAQKNGKSMRDKGFTYSYDMLGEAALTTADANKYFKDYLMAIEAVGRDTYVSSKSSPAPSVSIKLSALHPRYEVANEDRVLTELCDTLEQLLRRAVELDVAITIDAEEADRLELSLKLFEKLYRTDLVKGWGKFGLVIQAYSKRALPVLVWLNRLAKEQGDLIPLRLVKGAYWDSEIKWSQQAGFTDYPVYTRKEATDVAYLACARYLLSPSVRGNIFPQFASHNAHTVSAIAVMTEHKDFEFQRLHGMGDSLYNHAMEAYQQSVRIYAPVGSHKDLLPYLVRRLLENGANSSFVHRLVDARCPVAELTQHPVDMLLAFDTLNNTKIPLPPAVFPERKNSYGVNIDIESEAHQFEEQVKSYLNNQWTAGPVINGESLAESMIKADQNVEQVTAPYDRRINVGQVAFANLDHVSAAITGADAAFADWNATSVETKAAALEKLADLMEDNLAELVAICHQEAGKTIHDSVDEVREAVDFCRYYAKQANNLQGFELKGFDGQTRIASRQGRGVFVCISPWNFPLAIFLGQITAALVAGNTVVAKPAEQTSLIAARAVELMNEAGFPAGTIQLLPGRGAEIGSALTSHDAIAGVAFTGSTPTAQRINVSLASRNAKPVPFIAETGGQNAMIVDSTALPEQVVRDVIRSAFASAGQRCSALRVLYIQEDIADRVIALIHGAMDELSVGIPHLHKTDVGPVIDQNAKQKLLAHLENMTNTQKKVAQLSLGTDCEHGDFVPPSAFEIDDISCLKEEQFGPVLHIVRFKASELAQVVDQINQTGFGLTMGIHSRNETTYRWIEKHVRVGNCYINRDQVGAVVGVQPFGGQGLSGTGPKAGGPHYLYRFTDVHFSQSQDKA
ncbi:MULTISPECIES: bifunctional proline dehydrogenase/L-glutamate gamma-semialdehyde dehydrogenase PutA [Vibrio]|jgi:RHH-type transcriptional regulator, proline utilization regulon repressor / proline dehydrogenase / delta 1-pyrroline-5-carboxylate dehydrogenase|uniref:Bifunctional protein PutA n=1 Tax=Vibrio kanaloae TaxID=170673 RepID=A0A4U1Z7S8_9VIBR|nr:bifunctional proline dehydrogenase/L-glutamate gamma-semialdehyde dehydrogenase PutA [Vibrio kanaloae]KAB0465816.1 bifunctional proline dehydrogenase/L-glutamate gamma-semialdehyde dehydrogenase PutA [Vibrio kanaloae]MCG9558561.1 bifunctional proline dehydrogenase/L-glutamate gamma-semialdehyde dehydrogenase PutA [Vibrio kanaloae]NOI98477.1 bifunctional proline dehydrogenase/L-glutamate gamma-semialdehyde dehydrogenase PutA [Vibrio kanaloae]OEF14792.1 bifunctional proline dehydrogenase/L-glu